MDGESCWHFCSNCSQWPKADYCEQLVAPISEEMCDECEANHRQGKCDDTWKCETILG
jgi:hypothetical protein